MPSFEDDFAEYADEAAGWRKAAPNLRYQLVPGGWLHQDTRARTMVFVPFPNYPPPQKKKPRPGGQSERGPRRETENEGLPETGSSEGNPRC